MEGNPSVPILNRHRSSNVPDFARPASSNSVRKYPGLLIVDKSFRDVFV